MISEKVKQASSILAEEGIDLWITFVRESEVNNDPILDLILGANCTWQSAFMISSSGESIAIVGSLDETRIKETGGYEVIGYTKSIKEPLLDTLKKLAPDKIAVNFSENDYMADGLSHGMYLTLVKLLQGTGYEKKLMSAEKNSSRPKKEA